MQIVTLLSTTFAKRCTDQLDIDLVMSLPVRKHLVNTYADEKMGARPLKRAMQSVVEDAMAEALLKGEIARGDRVEVVLKSGEIAFVRKNAQAAAEKKATRKKKAPVRSFRTGAFPSANEFVIALPFQLNPWL